MDERSAAMLTAGSGVRDNIEAWGQLYDNARIADSMVKTNPDLATRMGFQDPKQFFSLSAQDKIAATTGYIKQQGVQEHLARMQEYQAAMGQREQQMQDEQTAGLFLENYFKAPATTTDPDGTTRPVSPQERLSLAAGNTPNMSGRVMPKVLDSLARWQAATDQASPEELTTGFVSDPKTGAHFVTRGKQILPAGYDSAVQQDGPVYSPDGKMFWNGKGWAQLKELGYPPGSTVQTQNGVNVIVGPNGQILKTIGAQSSGQALAEVLGTPKAASGGPAKTLTADLAKQYLQKAGGDKAKARSLATKDGYSY